MWIKEDIIPMYRLGNTQKIYYQTSAHLPRQNQTGQENFAKMKVDNNVEVWLLHPDLLPKFEQVVQEAGKTLVEFNLEQYLNFPLDSKKHSLFFD